MDARQNTNDAEIEENQEFIKLLAICKTASRTFLYNTTSSILENLTDPGFCKLIISFFAMTDEDGNTFGNMTASAVDRDKENDDIDNPANIYTNILITLIDTGYTAQEIFNIIALKNNHGLAFGTILARMQTPESINIFIRLLDKLINKGISANDIYTLIAGSGQQTSNSLLHAVIQNHDGLRIRSLLKFLVKLCHGSVSPDKIVESFASKCGDNTNLFDVFLFFQSQDEVVYLLDIFIWLILSGIEPSTVLDLISASLITEAFDYGLHSRHPVNKRLLQLLNVLAMSGLNTNDIVDLLMISGADKKKLIAKLIADKNENLCITLCDVINLILPCSENPQKIIDLLKVKVSDGNSILLELIMLLREGHEISCINILRSLFFAGASVNELVNLIRERNDHGVTFGIQMTLLPRYQNALSDFIHFVLHMYATTHMKDLVLPILISDTAKNPFTGKENWNMIQFMGEMDHIEPKMILELIKVGLLPDRECKKLTNKISEILRYILDEHDTQREVLIRSANNKNHPLGRYFQYDDSVVAQEARSKLDDELKKILQAKKIETRAKLFSYNRVADDTRKTQGLNLKLI